MRKILFDKVFANGIKGIAIPEEEEKSNF